MSLTQRWPIEMAEINLSDNMRHGHLMVGLDNGKWTCACGDIHASDQREDVMIHLVWEYMSALDRVVALAESWRASPTLGGPSIMVRAALNGSEPY